jgi:hypothetical protein
VLLVADDVAVARSKEVPERGQATGPGADHADPRWTS